MTTLNIFEAGNSVDKKSIEVSAHTASGTHVVFYIEKFIIEEIATEKDLNFQELVDTEGIVRAVKEILE